MNQNILKLFLSILICQGAGLVGSFAVRATEDTWYSTIKKPSSTPPNWVFGPVWIVMYGLMGVALYLVWVSQSGLGNKNIAIVAFMIHLILNVLWSFLFFYFKNPFLALIEIILLWAMILICVIVFFPLSQWAGILMIPYLLWVTFASGLNFSIWHMNR